MLNLFLFLKLRHLLVARVNNSFRGIGVVTALHLIELHEVVNAYDLSELNGCSTTNETID
jgi:hypothetical protein